MDKAFYQRQISLKEVGLSGQQKLIESRVLVIGAGGLGCPVLEYLTAAGVGHISICDFDTIDYSNLHRQVLYTPEDTGKFKAEIAAIRLRKQNPNIEVQVILKAFDLSLDISSYDLVLDCSDNFKTKFMAHDLCYKNNTPLVQASIHRFEGQIHVFTPIKQNQDSPCLRCLWPVAPEKSCVQNCEEAGVLGVVPGVVGSMQASEAIKYLLGLSVLGSGKTLMINLLDYSTQSIKWPKDLNCPLCSKQDVNLAWFSYGESILEISFEKLIEEDYTVISLIGDQTKHIHHDLSTNLTSLLDDTKQYDKNRSIVVFCNIGVTSLKAVKILRENGFINSFSLNGGLQAKNI